MFVSILPSGAKIADRVNRQLKKYPDARKLRNRIKGRIKKLHEIMVERHREKDAIYFAAVKGERLLDLAESYLISKGIL